MVYYSKYPFSIEAEEKLKSMSLLKKPLDQIYDTPMGKKIFELAIKRLRCAIFNEEYTYKNDVEFLLSYSISKVILYNVKNNSQFIKKFIKYESTRVFKSIKEDKKMCTSDYKKIFNDYSLNDSGDYINLCDYLNIRKNIDGSEYKLVNRTVKNGMVNISDIDKEIVCRSKINAIITKDIDNATKIKNVCDMTKRNSRLKEILDDIAITLYEDFQLNIRTDYGDIENECFPPCINLILYKISNNEPVAHHERFFMVTFLKEIGVTLDEIVNYFSKSPKFNYNQTTYQIRHIIGEEHSEKYIVPMCATAKTHGYCNCGTNVLCGKVKHPLGYYIVSKKKIGKQSTNDKKWITKTVKDALSTDA